MNKIVCMLFAAIFILGCTPVHYIQKENRSVKLFLQIPDARDVQLAASLDSFKLRKARQSGSSTWVVEVPAEKEFTYFYIVDGKIYVPDCQLAETDDFGGKNCIFVP